MTHSPLVSTIIIDYMFNLYLVQIDSKESSLIYSNLVGKSSQVLKSSISTDSEGSIYVSGATDSNELPKHYTNFSIVEEGANKLFILRLSIIVLSDAQIPCVSLNDLFLISTITASSILIYIYVSKKKTNGSKNL